MNTVLKVGALLSHSKNRFLLIKEQYTPGADFKWNLIKGTVDDPSETLKECVKREIKEEVGIQVNDIELRKIIHYGDVKTAKILFVFYADIPFVSEENIALTRKNIPDENIVEAKWFTIEEIRKIPLESFMAPYVQHALSAGSSSDDGGRISEVRI